MERIDKVHAGAIHFMMRTQHILLVDVHCWNVRWRVGQESSHFFLELVYTDLWSHVVETPELC